MDEGVVAGSRTPRRPDFLSVIEMFSEVKRSPRVLVVQGTVAKRANDDE